MAMKYIDVMDTTFRDGLLSTYGTKVLSKDFLPVVEVARDTGISHFEVTSPSHFFGYNFYTQENIFNIFKKFREAAGAEANLQILARGVSNLMQSVANYELTNLFTSVCANNDITTIRTYDALNDIRNLDFIAERITEKYILHEISITMMELPQNIFGSHNVAFYERKLREILDSGIPFDSIAFKDATGTITPAKIYETVSMARKLLGDDMHISVHSHDSVGVGVPFYLAALDAGANGIDLAMSPASRGNSQPDMLSMLHAVRGMGYNLGDLNINKLREYQKALRNCLSEYEQNPKLQEVEQVAIFAPMATNALNLHAKQLAESGNLGMLDDIINEIPEVIDKGGYATSIMPVSQYYWQQAYANVKFGRWKKITNGYGKMVLGYLGRTPTAPHPNIFKLAKEELKLEATLELPIDVASEDETKTIDYYTKILESENIETTEENIFILASSKKFGLKYLKGELKQAEAITKSVSSGKLDLKIGIIETKELSLSTPKVEVVDDYKSRNNLNITGVEIRSKVSGKVFKISKNIGDIVEDGEVVLTIENVKESIDVKSTVTGAINGFNVSVGDRVTYGELLFVVE